MITRRFFISGIVTTTAVASASQYIPAVAAEPQPYATVVGIGWDNEVIEHVIYEPMSVGHFGGTFAINKFKQVTEWVYAFPVEPLPETYNNSNYLKRYGTTYGIPAETVSTHEYGEHAIKERTKQIAHWQKEIVKEDGFTRIMGLKEIDDWRAELRPDVPPYTEEWMKIQNEGKEDYKANAAKYIAEVVGKGTGNA
jgi:hypothetical protein